MLLAAVTAPTDAAAVFSVLRRVPLPRRLTGALEAESGLNDAPTVLLVTLASQGDLLEHGVLGFLGIVVLELAGGVLIGGVVGLGGAWVMRRVALPASGLYPLAVLSLCVLSYAGASALHASGFAAVYTAALILGNTELPHRGATRSFTEGLGLAGPDRPVRHARAAASPRRASTRTSILHAVVAGCCPHRAGPAALGAARARSGSAWPARTWRSSPGRGCVARCPSCWPRSRWPRGSTGPRGSSTSSSSSWCIDTLVTGPTLPWVARRLGVSVAGRRPRPRDRVGSAGAAGRRPPADPDHQALARCTVSRSGSCGCRRGRRCPSSCATGQTKVPTERTVLRSGDDLLVVTPRKVRGRTESRLRAVSQRGRLAYWLE